MHRGGPPPNHAVLQSISRFIPDMPFPRFLSSARRKKGIIGDTGDLSLCDDTGHTSTVLSERRKPQYLRQPFASPIADDMRGGVGSALPPRRDPVTSENDK